MKSIQLNLYWPHLGFQIDRIHLVSIDAGEWSAMSTLASTNALKHPLLLELLQRDLPAELPRAEFKPLKQECERHMKWEKMDQPDYSALSTLFFSIGQAERQREASLIVEPSEETPPDEYTIISPGADLLEDLEGANEQ